MSEINKQSTPNEMVDNINDDITNEEKQDNSQAGHFLTFETDGLTFGVSTEQVIEIITNHNIRPLPLVPEYIRGIINLRGQIIPIIDMRIRLGKEFMEYTSSSCIIILDIGADRVGICVDAVCQVLTIDTSLAKPIPLSENQKLATSMVSIETDKVVLLLDSPALTQP